MAGVLIAASGVFAPQAQKFWWVHWRGDDIKGRRTIS